MRAKFFCIPNLTCGDATEIRNPEKLANAAPYTMTKAAFTRWSKEKNTQHYFLSLVEGVNASIRVTDGFNEPRVLHGFFADYDSATPSSFFQDIANQAPSQQLPAYHMVTKSGNGRLVWEFEDPITVGGTQHAEMFFKVLADHIKAARWLPNFDKCSERPGQYFELGIDWKPIENSSPIPYKLLRLWDHEALEKLARQRGNVFRSDSTVPMEVVAREVSNRYPGRFRGEFVEGARGVRFWDPKGDNEAGITVYKWGVRVWTPHDKPVMTWEDIFGKEFIEEYKSQSFETQALDLLAFDGLKYWLKSPSGQWVEYTTDSLRKALSGYGISRIKSKETGKSAIDELEEKTILHRRVAGAFPFLFYKSGFVDWNGQSFLNTSFKKPIAPAASTKFADGCPWEDAHDGFPFIHEWLSTFFRSPIEGYAPRDYSDLDPDKQLEWFLAWLGYFYRNSYVERPCAGQALVVAGPADKGKSFLAMQVIGKLMGGFYDAAQVLINNLPWTNDMAAHPIIGIDDDLVGLGWQAQQKFTTKVKGLVAKPTMHYNGKHMATGQVPWYGRFIITCNTDQESLGILPSMESTTRDKISLLRSSRTKGPIFATRAENEVVCTRELPHFARWLQHAATPEWCDNGGKAVRFGTIAVQHPTMLSASGQRGLTPVVFELLRSLIKQTSQGYKDGEHKMFNASLLDLHGSLSNLNERVMRTIDAPRLSIVLGSLIKMGHQITCQADTGSGTAIYSIPASFADHAPRLDEEYEETSSGELVRIDRSGAFLTLPKDC